MQGQTTIETAIMKHIGLQRHRVKNRYGLLLAFFLAELISTPLLEGSKAAAYAADLFFYLVLAAAVFSIRNSRFFKLAIVLGAGALAAETCSYFAARTTNLVAANFLACAFLVVVTLKIGVNVAKQDKIQGDTVMGGLCVYVLMGIFWTILFLNLELIKPGSFDFTVHGPRQDLMTLYSLMFYYSFVTLLTIGFGDVAPMSGTAQTLTILEGLIGQFYLIFFMASLVGLYIYRRESGPPDNDKTDADHNAPI